MIRNKFVTFVSGLLVILAGASAAQAQIGTLDDEKAFNQKMGWAWTASQLPQIVPGPYGVGPQDVHNWLEDDDLWLGQHRRTKRPVVREHDANVYDGASRRAGRGQEQRDRYPGSQGSVGSHGARGSMGSHGSRSSVGSRGSQSSIGSQSSPSSTRCRTMRTT